VTFTYFSINILVGHMTKTVLQSLWL